MILVRGILIANAYHENVRPAIAIMAAGKGTRLKSKHPKVLHEVGGKPLLSHVIAAGTKVVPPNHVYAIIGHEADRVREAVAPPVSVSFCSTAARHGPRVDGRPRSAWCPTIMSSCSPAMPRLFRLKPSSACSTSIASHKPAMTMLTAELENPTGYGRVLRKGKSDEVSAMVEEKSATPAQKKVREINSGIYALAVKPFYAHLGELSTDNRPPRVLPDRHGGSIGEGQSQGHRLKIDHAGRNPRQQYPRRNGGYRCSLRLAKCHQLMAMGVTIFFPQTCVIDAEVEVGPDTVLEPFVQLLGKTRIGSDCRIQSYNVIRDSEIADRTSSCPGCMVEGSRVGAGAVRSLLALASGQRNRRKRTRGKFCRNQESPHGKGIESQPSDLFRRCRDWRRGERRGRHHHLQLRRRPQI